MSTANLPKKGFHKRHDFLNKKFRRQRIDTVDEPEIANINFKKKKLDNKYETDRVDDFAYQNNRLASLPHINIMSPKYQNYIIPVMPDLSKFSDI